MRARSHQPPGRGPLVAHAARGSTTSKTLTLDRCQQYGHLRLLEVTEERNGPLGLRDDDDDDDYGMSVDHSRTILHYIPLRAACTYLTVM